MSEEIRGRYNIEVRNRFEALGDMEDNNNNNTYIAPISILLFSSALKNKNIFKKILRLHKAYMQKVHEPTKKSKTITSTLKL